MIWINEWYRINIAFKLHTKWKWGCVLLESTCELCWEHTHFRQSLAVTECQNVWRNRHFAQHGLCAAESKTCMHSSFRAYFQRTLQMVFKTLQLKNETQWDYYSVLKYGSRTCTQSVPAPPWSANDVAWEWCASCVCISFFYIYWEKAFPVRQ